MKRSLIFIAILGLSGCTGAGLSGNAVKEAIADCENHNGLKSVVAVEWAERPSNHYIVECADGKTISGAAMESK